MAETKIRGKNLVFRLLIRIFAANSGSAGVSPATDAGGVAHAPRLTAVITVSYREDMNYHITDPTPNPSP